MNLSDFNYANKDNVITVENGKLTVNGFEYSINNPVDISPNYPLYLFGAGDKGDFTASTKTISFLKRCIIENENGIVSDIIPVKRLSDSAIGYYDLRINEFYLDPDGIE